ncbi:MAG: hypothetical protein MMC33_005523 [Icmadophila ericetorum]|nr:hypothetical protein [Icmadophila ericetorum]
MALAVTAAIGGIAAAAAYLNAKLQLQADYARSKNQGYQEKEANKILKHRIQGLEKRISAYYIWETAGNAYPDEQAIWSRSGNYTWREAHDRVHQYASYLLSLGVQPGSIVAVYLQNQPEFIFLWIALWALGSSPVFLNWNLAGEPLVHCIKISGAKIMIFDTEEGCSGRINAVKNKLEEDLQIRTIPLTDELKSKIATLPASRPDDRYRANVTPTSPAMLIYTSGTTGFPKAFPCTQAFVYAGGVSKKLILDQKFGRHGDRWYNCMPMYHGTGGITSIHNLLAGITVCIGRKFSLSKFWSDIRDSEATWFTYVGETARYLLAAPPSPLDKQHKLRGCFGNGMRSDVTSKFQERFAIPEKFEFFASTESMFYLSNHTRSSYGINAVGHHGFYFRWKYHDVMVLATIDPETGDMWRDPDTGLAKRAPYAKGGELLIRMATQNDWVGYWNSSAATEKKLARNVFKKGDIYFRTGDALRRDDDGYWFFLDRLGDTYRWKSENVSTAEVSSVLGQYPGLLEANVYGVLVPNHDGRAGCAAVALDPSASLDRFDWVGFTKYVRKMLPRYAVPVFLRILDGEVSKLASHNNKQIKGPLRLEGVDPSTQGSKVEGGENHRLFWLPPKGDRYVPFEQKNWDNLVAGRARL